MHEDISTSRQEFPQDGLGPLQVPKTCAPALENYMVIGPDKEINISGVRLIITDFDDTLLQNSGQVIHDGPQGRFWNALNILRCLQGQPLLSPEQAVRFKNCGGGAATDVFRSYVETAKRLGVLEELFKTTSVDQAAKTFGALAQTLLIQYGPLQRALVPPDPFAKEILKRGNETGAAIVVCSATEEASIRYLTRANFAPEKGEEFFDHYQCNAVKRGPDCAAPIEAILKRFGVSPSQALMLGDSDADAICANAAGVHCILRPPVFDSKDPALLERARLERMARYEKWVKDSGQDPCLLPLVVWVESFQQVNLVNSEESAGGPCFIKEVPRTEV
jgi:phosphoglycolate phosphatase-like HAD superfamily hydrolase